MNKKLYLKAYTLLEIVVSLVIVSIGVLFLAKTMFLSKVNFVGYSDDSNAVNIAYMQMQQFLAQSYDVLGTRCINSTPSTCHTNSPMSTGRILTQDPEPSGFDTNYTWRANIDRVVLGPTTGPLQELPYKDIEVIVNYTERDSEGVRHAGVKNKYVRLHNVVPYPLYHTRYFELIRKPVSSNGNIPNEVNNLTTEDNAGDGDFGMIVSSTARNYDNAIPRHSVVKVDDAASGLTDLRMNVRFETRKDIAVFYNIVTELGTGTFSVEDTILSCVWIGRAGFPLTAYPIVTRTLITEQRVINNSISIKNNLPIPGTGVALPVLEPNQIYTIEVRAFKNKRTNGTLSGDVNVRSANIIVVATDHT